MMKNISVRDLSDQLIQNASLNYKDMKNFIISVIMDYGYDIYMELLQLSIDRVEKVHYMNGKVYENIHKYTQLNDSIRTFYTGRKIISPYGTYGEMNNSNQLIANL